MVRFHVTRGEGSQRFDQVLSSIIAAWADKMDAPTNAIPALDPNISISMVTGVVRNLDVGYLWMLVNCWATATYVSVSVSSTKPKM